ncbi:MAG: hypothetical protein LC117_05365 [Bacteroidia bacterium]|nr:hypothetical protein [Bacteroidia bacterium]
MIQPVTVQLFRMEIRFKNSTHSRYSYIRHCSVYVRQKKKLPQQLFRSSIMFNSSFTFQ